MFKQSFKKNYASSWLWMMWGIAALFYCYENILQVAPSVMVSEWMHDFHLTASAIGRLGAYYYYAYASTQIPVGMLVDYFGPRRLLTLAALVCALGVFVISAAHGFHLAAIGRAMIGLGSGFAAIGCLHIAATCLPSSWFACITGLTLSFGMLGAMGGASPFGLFGSAIRLAHQPMVFGLRWIRHRTFNWNMGTRSFACKAVHISPQHDEEKIMRWHIGCDQKSTKLVHRDVWRFNVFFNVNLRWFVGGSFFDESVSLKPYYSGFNEFLNLSWFCYRCTLDRCFFG